MTVPKAPTGFQILLKIFSVFLCKSITAGGPYV